MRPMLGMLVLYRFGSGSMSQQQKEDFFYVIIIIIIIIFLLAFDTVNGCILSLC